MQQEVVGEIAGLRQVPTHCAIDEPGRRLVVACQGDKDESGAVHIIDLETNKVTATILDEKIRGSIGVIIDN